MDTDIQTGANGQPDNSQNQNAGQPGAEAASAAAAAAEPQYREIAIKDEQGNFLTMTRVPKETPASVDDIIIKNTQYAYSLKYDAETKGSELSQARQQLLEAQQKLLAGQKTETAAGPAAQVAALTFKFGAEARHDLGDDEAEKLEKDVQDGVITPLMAKIAALEAKVEAVETEAKTSKETAVQQTNRARFVSGVDTLAEKNRDTYLSYEATNAALIQDGQGAIMVHPQYPDKERAQNTYDFIIMVRGGVTPALAHQVITARKANPGSVIDPTKISKDVAALLEKSGASILHQSMNGEQKLKKMSDMTEVEREQLTPQDKHALEQHYLSGTGPYAG